MHIRTQTQVAIKVTFTKQESETLLNESFDCAHLVGFYGAYTLPDCEWIVMELCSTSISEILKFTKSPLDELQIARVCQHVLKALVYLHESRHIHRDIKAGYSNLIKKHPANSSRRSQTSRLWCCWTAFCTSCQARHCRWHSVLVAII